MHDRETLGLIEGAGRSFARKWGGAARAREFLDNQLVHDRQGWDAVVEQGWLGLMVPEEKGGLGLSARALVALLQEIGSGLVMLPVLPGIATSALLAHIGAAKADAILSDLLSGKTIYLASLPFNSHAPYLFEGESTGSPIRACLHDLHAASEIIVFDERADQVGRMPIGNQETVRFVETIDGGSVGSVIMSEFSAKDLIASGPAVRGTMSLVQDIIAIGSAAMLLGCAGRALEMSLDYLKTRQQFGVAIGSFQALQHRAATLHVMLASSRSFLFEASGCFDGSSRTAACAAARARAADCALQVVKEAVQFHGAIGFADEHDIGLYFRRVIALAAWQGNSSQWRKEYFGVIGHRYEDRNEKMECPGIARH